MTLPKALVAWLVAGTLLAASPPAEAQERPPNRAQSAKKPKRSKAPPRKPAPEADAAKPAAEAEADPKSPEAPAKSGESAVQAAGTQAPAEARTPTGPVKEAENKEGVKTYEFGAVEVEGRLRSPQILYFLRRVRAEFDAAALGHRSFLRELSHTRNDSVFR